MSVKRAAEVEAKNVPAGQSTTIQVLISAQEGPNFALRKFTMLPGGGMPLHTNTVEHEQYVLNGQAHITIGDQAFDVRQGDVVFIPEGVPHSYQNTGDDAFAFLCIIPNKPDEIKIVGEGC
jgi:quercetin dioxygenase-like cupin family protein